MGAVLLGVVTWAPRVRAHTLLVTPPPRDERDGYKDPSGPCGVFRTSPPQPLTEYTAGESLHVEWRETIDHPGCFVIDFAETDDRNFQILGVKSHQGAAGGMPRDWSLDVTLPRENCTGCTLRSRQLMLAADVPEAQCPPSSVPSGATYYSCANIVLTGALQPEAGESAADAAGDAPAPAAPRPAPSGEGCQFATEPTPALAPFFTLALGGALGLRMWRRQPRRPSNDWAE
jgi:MYXO-CTERM domain-containing protein